MPEYDVDIEIVKICGDGICSDGHKVGDKFKNDDPKLCPSARNSLYPYLTALRFGGEAPWKNKDKHILNISCPDGDNPVVYQLTRVPKK